MLASGTVDAKPLISHRFKLSELHEAFELARRQPEGVMKVMIDCSHNWCQLCIESPNWNTVLLYSRTLDFYHYSQQILNIIKCYIWNKSFSVHILGITADHHRNTTGYSDSWVMGIHGDLFSPMNPPSDSWGFIISSSYPWIPMNPQESPWIPMNP